MFGIKKKTKVEIKYDPEVEQPALKTSICTGEKVAGFININSKKFRDVVLVRNSKDLDDFCQAIGVREEDLKSIV
ncbi:MAG: aspartate dehydrogenase [Eubacterium sp.]|nr:aspartate dehydrogenase [Eubacterium sp.]